MLAFKLINKISGVFLNNSFIKWYEYTNICSNQNSEIANSRYGIHFHGLLLFYTWKGGLVKRIKIQCESNENQNVKKY